MHLKKIILAAFFLAVFIFGKEVLAAEWCHYFNVGLKLGSRGWEVGALQAALQKEGLLSGKIDGIFGLRTRNALIIFQNKYKEEILTPSRLNSGNGLVGKATRAKLNKLYGCLAKTPSPATTIIPVPVPVLATSSITVISPNGGDKLTQGNNLNIQWTSSGLDKVNIILINYSTGDQLEIANLVSAALGQYSWPIADTVINGDKYKITVKSGKTIDLSDNYFSIASVKKTLVPSLYLFSPNGGDQWVKGQAYSIRWLFQDIDKIDSITLTNYSKNETYSLGNNIGASLNSNSFTWTVPLTSLTVPASNMYKIKLQSCISGACYSAQSASYFSIQ